MQDKRISDVAEFQQCVQHIRDYLSGKMAIERANKQSVPQQPAFSFTRVLRVLKWAFLGFWLLFVFCLLAVAQTRFMAFVLLFTGLGCLLAATRRRKKTAPVATGIPTAEQVAAAMDSAAQTAAAGLPDPPPETQLTVPFVPADDVFPLLSAVPRPAVTSVIERYPGQTFVISLSVWVAIAALSLPKLTPTWLVLTVLLHEVGHFLVMYFRGYSKLGMFFIPFFAGAVTGTKENETPADRMLMLFAGPAPGLLAGCLIYWIELLHPLPLLRSIAIWLVAINLLNLMPAWPLDGGRICWALFARQSSWAQFTLSAGTYASFSFLLFLPQNAGALVLLLILFILFFAPNAYPNARYTAAFIRLFPDPPATLQQFSERQLWELSRIVAATGTGTRAMRMLNTWSRIAILPKSPTPFRYFAFYMLLWGITLVTAAGTPLRQDALGTSEALSVLFDVCLPG
jgi:stage IV sporulation protein FB